MLFSKLFASGSVEARCHSLSMLMSPAPALSHVKRSKDRGGL